MPKLPGPYGELGPEILRRLLAKAKALARRQVWEPEEVVAVIVNAQGQLDLLVREREKQLVEQVDKLRKYTKMLDEGRERERVQKMVIGFMLEFVEMLEDEQLTDDQRWTRRLVLERARVLKEGE